MERDKRNSSRFNSGCSPSEDCHEYSVGTVVTKKTKLYSSSVLRPADMVLYSQTM